MSKLREAAQALLEAVEDEGVRGMDTAIKALRDALAEDALVCLSNTHQQLDAALEYELVGRINGTYGGQWVFTSCDEAAIWPVDTAVYVRRVKK
jgi:hypothetical protein